MLIKSLQQLVCVGAGGRTGPGHRATGKAPIKSMSDRFVRKPKLLFYASVTKSKHKKPMLFFNRELVDRNILTYHYV